MSEAPFLRMRTLCGAWNRAAIGRDALAFQGQYSLKPSAVFPVRRLAGKPSTIQGIALDE